MTERWPNLFLVGAAKAGTTSLWRWLGEHPEIAMAPVKEPRYFSRAEEANDRLTPPVTDEAAYLRLFARKGDAHYRGEASQYLTNDAALEGIRGISPEARILISLREPVDRAYADYWQAVTYGWEERSFEVAVEDELERGEAGLYVGRSFYAAPVERWLTAFPGGVHVLFFEEWRSDPRRELSRVFRFLDVEDRSDRIETAAQNVFIRPRNSATRRLLQSPAAHAAGRLLVPRRFRPAVTRLLTRKARRPQLDESIRARLTRAYAPDVESLRELLGRDVPWSAFTTTAPPAAPRR